MRGEFLVITGPTASGKTAFVDTMARVCVAQGIAVEIVNGDMGQLYAPLSIGTAKPDLSNTFVPHHLFGILNEPVSFSAASYRRQVLTCVSEISARNALPIIVGGSLFYLKSLFYPPQELDGNGGAIEQMNAQDALYDEPYDEGIETSLLWEKLCQIDSARALAINKNDRYRIMRALTLWRTTGRLPSSCAPAFIPAVEHALIVAVTRERNELNSRIDCRVAQMFEEGLLGEIAALGPQWWEFLCEKKLIGYCEVIKKLSGLLPVNGAHMSVSNRACQEVMAAVQCNTRAYAKRQMTFLRAFFNTLRVHSEYKMVEANLTLSSDYLYIEQIVAWAKEYVPSCTHKGQSNG